MYGVFSLTVREDGKKTLHICKRNQITNEGRTAAVQLLNPYLSSVAQNENRIWSLAVGIDNTPPTLNDTATQFDPSDSDVWTSPFSFEDGECLTYASGDQYEVTITKVIPTGEATDMVVAEAGLLTRGTLDDPTESVNRKLYARQIHSPITKTENMSIEYSWTLGFNVST